jgi:transcriptional regulator with XRE-family HTH domain
LVVVGWVPPDDLPQWLLALRRHVGANLRRERMARGWSQEYLAERAGLDRRTVGSIENATRSPLFDHLALLADALGIPLRMLLD